MAKVIIFGGTSDIGVSLAHEYAHQGFSIVLAGRNPEKLKDIQKDIEIRYSVKVETVLFDATNFASHPKLVDAHKDLDEAVCVFGYLGQQSVAMTDFREAEQIIDVNFKGSVSILNCIARSFKENNGKIIIGVSSVAGDRGRQSNFIYGSAKAAFSTYLQGLRNSLDKSKIKVLTVKPGYVDTKMTKGIDLPKWLTVSPQYCAGKIFRARTRSSDVVYISSMWGLIMMIIKLIPERIFKKLSL